MGGPADNSFDYLPFKPMASTTAALVAAVTAAVGITAANVTLPVGDAGNNEIEIQNQTTGWLSINLGDSTVTAVTAAAGYPVAPGARRVIRVDPYVTTASCLSSVAGNVSFVRGQGMN